MFFHVLTECRILDRQYPMLFQNLKDLFTGHSPLQCVAEEGQVMTLAVSDIFLSGSRAFRASFKSSWFPVPDTDFPFFFPTI